jgi:hypothetical protein
MKRLAFSQAVNPVWTLVPRSTAPAVGGGLDGFSIDVVGLLAVVTVDL